jgi:hypothetical protein
VPSYVFEIKVAGTVRVRAADEMEARKVVPAVLVLPGPDEVRIPTTTMPGSGGTQLLPRSISV